MEDNKTITVEEVTAIVAPLARKYDWSTFIIEDGVRLTINDGQEYASVDITTGEDIEGEVNRLIEAVDNHEYTVIG